MAKLATGDKSPGFEAGDQGGALRRLADLKGKRLFIFFYPKAKGLKQLLSLYRGPVFVKKIIGIIVLLTAVFHSLAMAADHYVSSGGSASWTDSTSISTPCMLYTANQNAGPGDTILITQGTYYIGPISSTGDGSSTSSLSPGIIPVHSGSEGSPIEYTVNGSDVVNFVGVADTGATCTAIRIVGKRYIKVVGKSLGQLNFTKMAYNIYLGADDNNDTSYNELAYLSFTDGYVDDTWAHQWQGVLMYKRCFYNHIHHNRFGRYGYQDDCDGCDYGNVFDLGSEGANNQTMRTYYNVIEDNEFYHGGHGTFGWFGDHNVIRNNYFHNEPFSDVNGSDVGYRNIIGDGFDGYVGHSLFEGNRIGHAAEKYWWAEETQFGGTGLKLCHPYNLLRYNSFFNNKSVALSFGAYFTALPTNNYVYNNTFFSNGFYKKAPSGDPLWTYLYSVNFLCTDETDNYGSVFRNNLFYNNSNTYDSSVVWHCDTSEPIADLLNPAIGNTTISNNYNGSTSTFSNVDPLFVDTTMTSYSSWSLPDLNLAPSSPAIDDGAALTIASAAGSSETDLVVDDARYFQDGNFGTGTILPWPSSVDIQADHIAIGTVANTVQVMEVNYSTNTITLASPMTWSDNAPIWLYKKSDGVVVLAGSAPDAGAHEYNARPGPGSNDSGSSGGGSGGCFLYDNINIVP